VRKKILVCSDWFTPGFRAGGPIRSVENLARLLCNDADIYILTSDRDLKDTQSYPGITCNKWVDYAPGIKVYYAAPGNQNKIDIKNIITGINPQALYLNSMFSKNFAIIPLMVSKQLPGLKVVLSPRGMLRSSALAFKPLKKKLFLAYARITKLFSRVHFHATDEQEVADIKKHIHKNVSITFIGNVPAAPDTRLQYTQKNAGAVSIIFTGRIHPIKNLHLLLESLKAVKSEVSCTLVGVMEDVGYWNRCKEIIAELPQNIKVLHPVEITPAELAEKTRQCHLFVLPTQGENFGHAIFEALCCGRPVLISDQTPWKNLVEKNAGWDLPLNSPAAFSEKIETVAAMNETEWQHWCNGAHQLAQSVFNDTSIKEKYLQLFS
jgi:glycosyltransferase involved in cell wall biosynthesis